LTAQRCQRNVVERRAGSDVGALYRDVVQHPPIFAVTDRPPRLKAQGADPSKPISGAGGTGTGGQGARGAEVQRPPG
jgi:hypothetical protein